MFQVWKLHLRIYIPQVFFLKMSIYAYSNTACSAQPQHYEGSSSLKVFCETMKVICHTLSRKWRHPMQKV